MRRIGGDETHRNVLVDGNNLIHRAHAVHVDARLNDGRPLLCGPKGYPTGVIYGSLSFLGSWLYELNATKISVFFDGIPRRRLALDSKYKDRETKSNLKIAVQSDAGTGSPLTLRDKYAASNEIDVLAHLFQLLGCDVYHHPDEEADDLIASFIKQHNDDVNVIVSDDKDFFQLLTNPRVVIFRPGGQDTKFYDAEVAEKHWAKLNGGKHPPVPSTHVRMFKSLCGDSSDGIPGVERLRKKVAITVCHHQDVESLYASGFPGFSEGERQKIIEMKERVILNHQLVGLIDDIDLSKTIRPAITDHLLAGDICREDLHMFKLDLKSYRLGPQSSEVPSIPMDDWLQNI